MPLQQVITLHLFYYLSSNYHKNPHRLINDQDGAMTPRLHKHPRCTICSVFHQGNSSSQWLQQKTINPHSPNNTRLCLNVDVTNVPILHLIEKRQQYAASTYVCISGNWFRIVFWSSTYYEGNVPATSPSVPFDLTEKQEISLALPELIVRTQKHPGCYQ